jgi:transcriptional regulator with XRE-family HTH domain
MKIEDDEDTLARRASEAALAFASLVRARRKAMKMRQDEVALATGVGRRFLIDLEAGKSSCQLGRSLLVAEGVGLRLVDVLASLETASAPELPEMSAEEEAPK